MSFVSVAGLEAQRLSPPAERPPAGYKGQQYIDSRGCVFTRAGINGQNTWVPRIGLDKKQLCGPSRQAAAQALAKTPAAPAVTQAPAVAARPAAPAVSAPAAKPAQVAAAPAAPQHNSACPAAHPYGQYVSENGRRRLLCGSAPNFDAGAEAKRIDQAKVAQAQAAAAPPPVMRAKPVVAARPAVVPAQPVAAPVAAAAPAKHKSCPARHPYGQMISEGGRQRLMCSDQPQFDAQAAARRIDQANASAAQQSRVAAQVPTVIARAPAAEATQARETGMTYGREPQPMSYGREPQPMRARGAQQMGAAPMSFAPHAATPSLVTTPPAGYKPAWEDDRLNPYRAQGHAAGQAAQDQLWDRRVPSQVKKDVVAVAPVMFAAPQASAVALPQAAHTGYMIQIASFRESSNAAATVGRLQAMGLPMRSQNARGLQLVQAGPFADLQSARQALAQVRGAGFRDAYLR